MATKNPISSEIQDTEMSDAQLPNQDNTHNSTPMTSSPSHNAASDQDSDEAEPDEFLLALGHGPCYRCGTCESETFHPSTWVMGHEVCDGCFDEDCARKKARDREMLRRYLLPGVGNGEVLAAMGALAADGVRGVGEGGVVGEEEEEDEVGERMEMDMDMDAEENRDSEASAPGLMTSAERSEDEDARDEDEGEVGRESPPALVIEGAGEDEGVAPSLPASAVPPSARHWAYIVEPKPAPGFREREVQVLEPRTRSGSKRRRE